MAAVEEGREDDTRSAKVQTWHETGMRPRRNDDGILWGMAWINQHGEARPVYEDAGDPGVLLSSLLLC